MNLWGVCGVMESFWEPWGVILGAFWFIFGALGGHFGSFLIHFGSLGGHFGHLGGHWATFWVGWSPGAPRMDQRRILLGS